MKIAIQAKAGPFLESFSERWIAYCEKKGIAYKLVDCYRSDIVAQVRDCAVFLWHFHNADYKDALFAKPLLFSLQTAGIKVFPDFFSSWHFDDKLGQKYLLESVGAPLVPSYAFYSKKEALAWVAQTAFPKVFKLRGGAGANNVRLVQSKRQAAALVRKAFSRGFSQYDKWGQFRERFRRYRAGKESLLAIPKGLIRLVIPPVFARMHGREKGYIYFQDFIPGNQFDIRIVVVGDKAFALKRMVRKHDFRASGSGHIIYGRSEIDERCVQIAFAVNRKLRTQSVAYDFVFDEKNVPLIVEISYGYAVKAYDACDGYWHETLAWHEGPFNPQEWMIERLIEAAGESRTERAGARVGP